MVFYFRIVFTVVFCNIIIPLYGQKINGSISGKLGLDKSWSSTIYLSHISTFDDLYLMSNEMIVAKTVIDSLGYFNFNIDFLPMEENLFRLHIVKKDDTPATLIIGGRDENHLFLTANRSTAVYLETKSTYPPFKNVVFKNSKENASFQHITDLLFRADSLASESSASKRLLIEKQLEKDLFQIADTSTHMLVSLYAIFKNRALSNYADHEDFYKSYVKKWDNKNSVYFNSFKKQIPDNTSHYSTVIIALASLSVLTLIGFGIGKYGLRRTNNIKNLSVQERKIYTMLQQGASNQEISDHFNIGLSTVKSHVSSIYSKLNVKSRKGIINMK